MKIAEAFERIVRLVPGIGSYQDKEDRRDRDTELRRRIVIELDARRRELEEVERHLTDEGDLLSLPLVDRLVAKLDGLASSVRYAARGYRGMFDVYKLRKQQLDALRSFDEAVKRDVAAMRGMASRLHDSRADRDALKRAIDELGQVLDRLSTVWSKREAVVTEEARASGETSSSRAADRR